MRILLHEFITGGGWYAHGSPQPPQGLLAEGRAMLGAVAADFAAVAGATVDVLRDVRCRDVALPLCTVHEVTSAAQERQVLVRLAAAADWTLIVAPEFDGHLQARCEWVEQAGGRLLGPDSRLVALASDKHRTALHLAAAGLAVPRGVALGPFDQIPTTCNYPAILKPRDGAGSQGIEWIADCAQNRKNGATAARLETFCRGRPASVAVLCGLRTNLPLQPCWQLLSDDRSFAYTGGALPIPPAFARRATELALRAVDSLDNPLGYLGVDVVLGDDSGGGDDVVIEINPRLTTSYVGLRALAVGNLAAAMLATARGDHVELSWRQGAIKFGASGAVCPRASGENNESR